MIFYDTSALLEQKKENLEQFFYISNITIEELESIKTSIHKDDKIKYKARQIIKWLIQNQDKYQVQFYKEKVFKESFKDSFLFEQINNDKKIILTALYLNNQNKQLQFFTYDLSCFLLAKTAGLKTIYISKKQQNKYTGYSNIYCNSEQELADIYTKIYSDNFGQDLFNLNEYILLYDQQKNLIDKYKYTGQNHFSKIPFNICNSKMFGKVKPIDVYQQLAIDSFKTNQLTLIKGPAGTGKSLLSLAYLFTLLEEGQIDRIIIFCNTVATAGSAKLGYYPGDRTEKLLDSQIGNFLISKIGARQGVEKLIDTGQLILLPMSDIRGFDTSGMRAGIYITQAQNLNIELMKLALQRIGQDSICILDGDNDAQVDLNLYAGDNNGLKRVSEVFRGQSFYGQVTLKVIHRSRIANVASQM